MPYLCSDEVGAARADTRQAALHRVNRGKWVTSKQNKKNLEMEHIHTTIEECKESWYYRIDIVPRCLQLHARFVVRPNIGVPVFVQIG